MTDVSAQAMKRPILLSYPATFWVANVMELFERAAYYGLNAVLGRYLTDKVGGGLGFTADRAGFLQGIIYAAIYVIPILGGALADRYGYRRMLLFAFSLLSAGYYMSGAVSTYEGIFATLLLMAVGGGLFKPIISGTIARTTTQENSGLGFGLYYWMINLGALIAPAIVIYLRAMSWRYVFTASALYCALMLLPVVFVYRDPPLPENKKSVREVLGAAATVLSDSRFMLMILIYSCFWILYFQTFGTVLWYLRDFVDAGPANDFMASLGLTVKFDAEFVTMINAGTIVLLQVLVSFIATRFRPLPVMLTGMLIGTGGFLVLALTRSVWGFIAGMAVFSIGEMTTHPKYYSYIGLVAPEDKKAVYMGYAFLYGVIGSLIGSNLGGEMYQTLLTPVIGLRAGPGAARSFWLVFAALGVVAFLGFFLYDRFFSKDTAETRRRARSVLVVLYALTVIVGGLFFAGAVRTFFGEEPSWKTLIQATIMLGLGVGGLVAILRRQGSGAEA